MSTNEKTPSDAPSDDVLVDKEGVLRVEQDARLQKVKAEAATAVKDPGQAKQPLNPDG